MLKFIFIRLFIITIFFTLTVVSHAMTCKQAVEEYHLGRGAFANVYKVELPNLSYVAHKVYDRMGGGDPYPESMPRLQIVRKEAEKMKLFSRIFNEANSLFQVAEVIGIDKRNQFNLKEMDLEYKSLEKLAPTLILEYIDGISIYELIKALESNHFPADWLDKNKAEEAINMYNREVEKLSSFLKNSKSPYKIEYHYFSSEGYNFIKGDNSYHLNSLDLELHRPLNFSDPTAIISVSSDNVLISSSGQLFLIDPY